MVEPSLPSHDEVDAELVRHGLGIGAAELHGSLCGLLCGGGDGREGWLRQVLATPDADVLPPRDGALDRMYLASKAQLADADFGFDLLLPSGEQGVGTRADALLAWCRGFLGGFGLAAGARPPLSGEAAEALEDLAKIAASQLTYEDPDADEMALEEVAEFVRVAALLLHGDCVLGPRHRRRMH